eukprot:GHVR01169386.1.p1 GENE.GHVR01169386.1~~GHVR01169386.1.p1  ORF type:complete len:127 (+),score=3.21 GHVR01169386.1:319-699(+)
MTSLLVLSMQMCLFPGECFHCGCYRNNGLGGTFTSVPFSSYSAQEQPPTVSRCICFGVDNNALEASLPWRAPFRTIFTTSPVISLTGIDSSASVWSANFQLVVAGQVRVTYLVKCGGTATVYHHLG